MEKLEKIEMDGRIYFYYNGNFVDENYTKVPTYLIEKLTQAYLCSGNIINEDYFPTDQKELYDLIMKTKNKYYLKCIKLSEFAIENYINSDKTFVKYIAPILTSCYRLANRSYLAIVFYRKNKDKLIQTSALLTSVAAAYCDCKRYKEALICANKALKIDGESEELTMVYDRINRELKRNKLL